MSPIAIAIVFGIVFPVYNYIAGALGGHQSELSKEATREWVSEHPVASVISIIMLIAIPIAYWALAIIYLA